MCKGLQQDIVSNDILWLSKCVGFGLQIERFHKLASDSWHDVFRQLMQHQAEMVFYIINK